MNEDDQSDDTACHNPQCVLEDYLTDISQPPKLPSKEIPEKLPKETMSTNKENVPPISNQVCKDLKKSSCLVLFFYFLNERDKGIHYPNSS